MINFDWTIAVIAVSPILAYLVSTLGIFDIKLGSTKKIFKECLDKLRNEKIKIWKRLIIIRDTTLDENVTSSRLSKILEDEERYEELKIALKSCRKYFDFYYYYLLAPVFCIGIILSILKYLFFDFFSQETVIIYLSIGAVTSVLFIIFGMIFLMFKKKKLTESFDKVVSLPINL